MGSGPSGGAIGGSPFHVLGCDLEGVEGATPQTSLTQLTFKTMTTSNHAQADVTADDQILELTEGQLEAVEGGGVWPVLIPIMIDAITRL